MVGKPKVVWDKVLGAWREVTDNRLLDWAAALTYYAMLALFPGILVLVTAIGAIGDSLTQPLLDNLPGVAPGPVRDIVEGAIRGVQNAGASTGLMLIVSLAAALWSTSGYVGAFSRASGAIWHERAGRPPWVAIPVKLAITTTLLLLLGLIGLMVVFTGPLLDELRPLLGIEEGSSDFWTYLRWPVLMLLMAVLLAMLYTTPPDLERRRFRLLTTGSCVAIAIWVSASWVFSLYVGTIADFNRVYGSLAGVIVFLVWLWISNVAVLLGVQIDAGRAADGD